MSRFAANSTVDLSFTFHDSKLSCWRDMYFLHIITAYLILITGIAAMATRLFQRIYFLHAWAGRFYVMSMLWCTATSIMIHNTGIPIAVLYSFIWAICGLSVGWIAITLHQKYPKFRVKISPSDSKWKQILKRMLTVKTFHGCIMFVSWINIAGRVFVTPLAREFECYTYPVFKPVKSNHFNYTEGSGLTLVPRDDPNYVRLPWAKMGEEAWFALMFFAPFIGAILVGVAFLAITVRPSDVKKVSTAEDENKESVTVEKPVAA